MSPKLAIGVIALERSRQDRIRTEPRASTLPYVRTTPIFGPLAPDYMVDAKSRRKNLRRQDRKDLRRSLDTLTHLEREGEVAVLLADRDVDRDELGAVWERALHLDLVHLGSHARHHLQSHFHSSQSVAGHQEGGGNSNRGWCPHDFTG